MLHRLRTCREGCAASSGSSGSLQPVASRRSLRCYPVDGPQVSCRMSIARLSKIRIIELPLRNRSFGLYSAGSAISLIGMWMQRIAVGWLTWQLTGSGFWLGIVAFADFFPVVVIGPIAGTAAD